MHAVDITFCTEKKSKLALRYLSLRFKKQKPDVARGIRKNFV